LIKLDSIRLIRFNNLRVAIRVEEAIRMTIAPILTVWFVRFDRNSLFRLDSNRLIRLNHLRDAIRI
jgi:hypothetical protein